MSDEVLHTVWGFRQERDAVDVRGLCSKQSAATWKAQAGFSLRRGTSFEHHG